MKKKIALLLSTIFFFAVLFTLTDYGINWDTINHLPRGQAYLNYFLTGNKDYSNLPAYQEYWQNPSSLGIESDIKDIPRRSLYQNDSVPYDWFIVHDGNGHPPFSDIMASFSNYIFFQRLGLINDIDSYRIYAVVLASVLVGVVFLWTSRETSTIGGIVAALSLALYPLFWSESHFNTEKDIPETVFWSLTLYSIWKGITTNSWKWILISGAFLGFALGTKLNIVFIGFIVVPWVAYYIWKNTKSKDLNIFKFYYKYKKIIWASLLAPFLGLSIFIATWPYLWADPIDGILGVVEFYRTIGLTTNFDTRYIGLFGINTYPVQMVLYTTPGIILFFVFVGIVTSIIKLKTDKKSFYLLILLWAILPIVRVSMPETNIYGGLRQIMEYIPAFAILAGIGAYGVSDALIKKIKINKWFVGFLSLLVFVPHGIRMFDIHPNQTVYFNSFAGGLEGAKEKDLPSWGNSFGAAYRQGVVWINENAPENANIVYAHELIPNIPRIHLRRDLMLHNINRTGPLKKGEYAITLTYDGTEERSYYDGYLERTLKPVYQVNVDGVSILKVWINDTRYTKDGFTEEAIITPAAISSDQGEIEIDLGKVYTLARIEWDFATSSKCAPLKFGYSSLSLDHVEWKRLPGNIPNQNWGISSYGFQPDGSHYIQPFAADKARYLRYSIDPGNACFGNIERLEIYVYEEAV